MTLLFGRTLLGRDGSNLGHPIGQQTIDRLLESLTPRSWRDAEIANDCRAIEPGIGGPDGRRRILGGADWNNLDSPGEAVARRADDRACKLEPTCFASSGEMIDAIGRLGSVRRAVQRDRKACLRNVARGRGAAALIRDNGQAITLGRETQDRADEILAVGAIDP